MRDPASRRTPWSAILVASVFIASAAAACVAVYWLWQLARLVVG